MAFPKTQSGGDLMLGSPSAPDAEQYSELGLKFVGLETAGEAGKVKPAG
jgi:aspartyl-tRNA synthetase